LLRRRAEELPIVTVTGPRQSGKTTLCRATFRDKPYANLEAPDIRERALRDPRGFLGRFDEGAILDEVQRAPQLASYLQEIVDARPRPGGWVLTGSQHFALIGKVTQSLAGRTAMLQLLPLSHEELGGNGVTLDLDAAILRGGYPRLYESPLDATAWFADYVMNYVERDVRQLVEIGDLATFQTFLRLCAGRAGQVLNLLSLGADAGVSHATAKRWISVLEASYVLFRLQPIHRNVTKRLTKSPKLYFFDTGLASYLLGIRNPDDLAYHPLRGAVFENWVVSEVLKWRWNRGLPTDLGFYREARGAEIDLVLERALDPVAVEIKASRTLPDRCDGAFDGFEATVRSGAIPARSVTRRIVYAGDRREREGSVEYVPWSELASVDWS
jgi:predicted AAA+ superfamily ATPase